MIEGVAHPRAPLSCHSRSLPALNENNCHSIGNEKENHRLKERAKHPAQEKTEYQKKALMDKALENPLKVKFQRNLTKKV